MAHLQRDISLYMCDIGLGCYAKQVCKSVSNQDVLHLNITVQPFFWWWLPTHTHIHTDSDTLTPPPTLKWMPIEQEIGRWAETSHLFFPQILGGAWAWWQQEEQWQEAGSGRGSSCWQDDAEDKSEEVSLEQVDTSPWLWSVGGLLFTTWRNLFQVF